MEAQFKFYEIVRVVPDYKNPKISDAEGAILGMAQNPEGVWFYAVHIYKYNRSWYVEERHLEPTGRTDKRENFYDESTVKVLVDPVTYEGKIVDP